MSTIQSNQSYANYVKSETKRRKDNLVLKMFESAPEGFTINEAIILHRRQYPKDTRDISSIIVGLFYAARLNRDELNPRVNPDTGNLAAVYSVPAIPRSRAIVRETKLRRQLDKARQDKFNAESKITILEAKLEKILGQKV